MNHNENENDNTDSETEMGDEHQNRRNAQNQEIAPEQIGERQIADIEAEQRQHMDQIVRNNEFPTLMNIALRLFNAQQIQMSNERRLHDARREQQTLQQNLRDDERFSAQLRNALATLDQQIRLISEAVARVLQENGDEQGQNNNN